MRQVALVFAATLTVVAPASSAPASYEVVLANLAFGPAPMKLRVGDAVEWVNADIFDHSSTAKDGSFDVALPPKGQARVVLRRAGSVMFYCRYHPGMTGVLTVSR